MNFGKRLSVLADLVPPCRTVLDVGTDHAYLPVLLITEGKAERAVAGDIGEGPCEAARRTVALYGLGDRIDVRLGSGLSVVEPGETDVIVMAGMGAATMLQILDGHPAVWQSASCRTLVLQPMSDSDRIRRWCEAEGWAITREELAEDSHRLYEFLVLAREPGYRYPGLSYLVGDDLVKRRHPLLPVFVRRLAAQYRRPLSAMDRSETARQSQHYAACKETIRQLEEILNGNESQ